MAKKKTGKAKRKFSSFDLASAMQRLGVEDVERWDMAAAPVPPSPFFAERMQRLESFDLVRSEKGKELLIDAICEEALQPFQRLRIWKGAPLESDDLIGVVDYLVGKRRAYLSGPLLCVVEAKKDDFEQGMAQCLVEMEACRWNNEQAGKVLDILGIVTNGDGWQFYRLTPAGKVFQTLQYGVISVAEVLGALHLVFTQCDAGLI